MKQQLGVDIAGSYSFNKVAKTITFSGLSATIDVSNILVINDATANTLIYNFADPALGAASFSNNVLTLDLDTNTAAFNNTDKLQIWLDVPASLATTPTQVVGNQTDDLLRMLSRLIKMMESNATVDQQQRQRITLDAITGSLTLATVTTVGNVAAQTGLAGMDREMYINIAKQTYAQSIRSRLEFV